MGEYKKTYRMVSTGEQGRTTMVAIPPEVIRRAAEEAGLEPDVFIKQYQAIAHFDHEAGVAYTFEPILPDKG
jgi:hypothetical protein